jgi:hypothetical protein
VNRGLVKYRKAEASNPRVAYRKKAEKKMKRQVGQRACPPNLAMSVELPKAEAMARMVAPALDSPLAVALDPGI